ncbi:HET-domain-containing protein [Massarina eburnea CBS 473.64]|uniref:HET-domain-containing protein n=1 Tax=Massarina eburnea CBS 473.64 TaxID=1395130 RepID=A0A6A6RVX6_9PLEO|nr:HET-domain-containing protein [Massarina eburnea CBS 473.64]
MAASFANFSPGALILGHERCETCHSNCNLPISQFPKRVLEISLRRGEPVKLVELGGLHAPCVALSYCWGSSAKTNIRTTTSTISNHLRSIPSSSLPLLFQDVILICRALKIRYLWIDSLCIVQDSKDDWELESAKMVDIYSQSHLTIAASAFADPHTSIFSDRTLHILAEELTNVARLADSNIDDDNIKKAWKDIVSEYSRLNLTSEKDRLPALSGLAAKFSNLSQEEYTAGIWTNMLPQALLWEVK